jgi:hypothetical protein
MDLFVLGDAENVHGLGYSWLQHRLMMYYKSRFLRTGPAHPLMLAVLAREAENGMGEQAEKRENFPV